MISGLKQKLRSGEPVIGGWAMIGHPAVGEIMGRAGFDWVAVDLEHTATDIQVAENLIRAIDGAGCPALVRLTNNDENLIKRVMDSGASGLIVPMVESADDARAAVNAMYYPPRGKRGVGLARAQKYGPGFDEYRNWLESEAVCIVQIEHINAVKNARNILGVEGVDGYMLGPYDLSASLGKPGDFDNLEFKAAVEEMHAIGREMGKPGGLHIVEPDAAKLKEAIDKGLTFIAYSIDTRMIDAACRAGLKAIKGEK